MSLAASSLVVAAGAETDVRLRISTDGRTQIKLGLAEPNPKPEGDLAAFHNDFLKVLKSDLDLSGYFEIVSDIKHEKPHAVVESAVSASGRDLSFAVRLTDASADQTIFKRKYGSGMDRVAATAHVVADDIIFALTGKPGIANTRIAFVAGERGRSDLYVARIDGTDVSKLTQIGGIVMSPSWSPDGSRLAYVAYEREHPGIYVLGLASMACVRFTSFEGMNATPAWSPDGKKLALTLSEDGNPEIYVLSIDGTLRKRITFFSGIDCSPSWAPNGLELAFTSDRAGTPQIFITDAEGLNVRQLTFDGNYNTSPTWSPEGDLIAYVSRIDGKLQICTVDPFGISSRVLTSDGNNEDPAWSADGMHIVFSSTGGRDSGIYIMSRDGAARRRIIDGATRPRNPAWSPPAGFAPAYTAEG